MFQGAMSSAGVGPLGFLRSKVNAAVYQEALEHFMLPAADQLYGDAGNETCADELESLKDVDDCNAGLLGKFGFCCLLAKSGGLSKQKERACAQASLIPPAIAKDLGLPLSKTDIVITGGPALMGQLSTPSLLSGTLGCAKGFVHKVKLSDSVAPVRQKLRLLPLSVRDAVSAELEHLLKEGIIERVDASPWVSPIVVTQKKNSGIRMCVDLREPNKAIVVDSYPLPHMDELLSRLRGASVFSTIDLQSAYHQVLLHPDSRDLTAFITHEGLFRFCRVPYGLASAPAAFQKMMSSILQGLSNVANYLDDIIIWGRTSDEHECYLQAVLKRLEDAGLQLNVSKCCFHQTKLHFLGHTLTAQGIQPDEEHLAAILHAPAPADAAKLRSFLGLLSWFNKFIPDFATVVEPLRACLRNDAGFSENSHSALIIRL
ncbi:hypothetical protein NFI96_006743 [Prochilodus magdalenae]|nr:hypothetical protein NFI96_006743 [Prochilodus magdalenae]